MRRFIVSIVTTWLITVIALVPHVSAATSYVSMGDSVAAGAGLRASSSPSEEDTLCDRTSQAYPQKVASRLGTTVTNLACVGAKVDEGIYDEQERDGVTITPQLDRAFENGTPDIITITAGANDTRWVQFLQQCQLITCGTEFDDARAKIYRGDLRVELFWTIYRINLMSGKERPTILLTGYYGPLNGTICSGTEKITLAERTWINARTGDLNQAISSVADWFSNATYVPVSFSGHELCSDTPWIQGLSDAAPFHPNNRGQVAITNAVMSALGR